MEDINLKKLINLDKLCEMNSSNLNDYSDYLKETFKKKEIYKYLTGVLNVCLTNNGNETYQHFDPFIELHTDDVKTIFYLSRDANKKSTAQYEPAGQSINTSKSQISNSTIDSISVSLSLAPIKYNVYTFNAEDLEVFVPGTSLTYIKTITINPGEIFKVDKGRILYELVDKKASEQYLRVAVFKDQCTTSWLFDMTTKKSVTLVPFSSNITRLEFLIKCFLTFPTNANLSELVKLTHDKSHFVRWKAIKALIELDINTGITSLKTATNDEHIHVRNAAIQTTENFKLNKIIK